MISVIVGLRDGSMAMQLVIRSARAGERGERSTTVKSLDRSACHATPPSGTQMLVATSKRTRPKLYQSISYLVECYNESGILT